MACWHTLFFRSAISCSARTLGNACVHAQLLYDHAVEAVQACPPARARLRLGMRATHINLLACL